MDDPACANAAIDCPTLAVLPTGSLAQEHAATMSTRSATLGRLATGSLLLLYAAIWTVARPYGGLNHDARLYALQMLAKVQPGIFADDLFLRYGSQDNFTVFPLLCAPLAGTIGIEPAAALLTFLSSLAWLSLAFLVARELAGTRLAVLSLGLLVALPGWYGAYEVFHIAEIFLSARLPAEALSLGALLAFLRRRHGLAMALCLAAALVHPLMTLPMIGLLMLTVVREYAGPGLARLAVAAAVACGVVGTIVLGTESAQPLDEWVAVLRTRSAFLFPSYWRLEDWQGQAIILLTLSIAATVLVEVRSRHLAVSAVWLGAAGLLLAVVAGHLPDYPTLLRAQPWRWMWVSCLLAIITLPALLNGLWRRGAGTSARGVAILLATAWLLGTSGGGFVAAIAMLALHLGDRLPARSWPWMTRGAWAVLAVTLIGVIATSLQIAAYPLDTNREPMWVQRAVNFVGPTAMGCLVVAGGWYVATFGRGRAALVALAALAAVSIAVFGPRGVRDWTQLDYSDEARRAFEGWRELIPQRAEVLWTGNAMATWMLLERRSYFSSDQLAGLLYSPGMTNELQRRATWLAPLASPGWWTLATVGQKEQPKELTSGILSQICGAPGLDYVVSTQDVGGAMSRVRRPGREIDFFLYDCRAQRSPVDRPL